MRKEGLAHRKHISGYHRCSLAETAMYRFKQLLTGKSVCVTTTAKWEK